MELNRVDSPVTGMKLSSVVPARVTGDNKPHQLTAMDLAVKLHYIRAVYFFKTAGDQRLTTSDLKVPMFRLLEIFCSASGRIRRSDPSGRPYVRCNDSGVRIVEAFVEDLTVDDWLRTTDRSRDHRFLVYDQVLGPDLGFSPLVFLQMTWFKCGGVSIGLSWAHILGDCISASVFMNTLGQISAVPKAPELAMPAPKTPEFPKPIPQKLFSIKKIDPVGDHWLIANKSRVETHTFRLSHSQIDRLIEKNDEPEKCFSCFEIVSAIIWRSMMKIQNGSGPKIISVCTTRENRNKNLSNEGLEISIVEADVSSENENDVFGLATRIVEKRTIENRGIEETIEEDGGTVDFIMYGANLTFVNLEGADVYGMELRGVKPSFVNYTIHGVGDEGVVLVFPGPEDKGQITTAVTMVLPEEKLTKLRGELKNYWETV